MNSNIASPLLARPSLAVVEDEKELREDVLLPALQTAGFQVAAIASALELYRMWASSPFDLLLLDAGLPDDDGFEIARHLRGLSPSLGIVMYTGHGNSIDRIRGLRAGVDAYLVKPVGMDVVVETLLNVHRRQAGRDIPGGLGKGRWSLDRLGWLLAAPSGVAVRLNQAERQIMGILSASPSAVVPREILIGNLSGDVDGFDPHRLEMLIYRLRRKCLDASGEALPLQAVRGVGYLFEP